MPFSAAITYFVMFDASFLSLFLCVTHLVSFSLVYVLFSFTLRCYSIHFSAFSLSVILCVVSDLPEFCHLCGLGFDRDPYEVVTEQMIDESALRNDRVFTYFA